MKRRWVWKQKKILQKVQVKERNYNWAQKLCNSYWCPLPLFVQGSSVPSQPERLGLGRREAPGPSSGIHGWHLISLCSGLSLGLGEVQSSQWSKGPGSRGPGLEHIVEEVSGEELMHWRNRAGKGGWGWAPRSDSSMPFLLPPLFWETRAQEAKAPPPRTLRG